MNALPGSAPHFSLIIPAYNEEAYLPVLLDSVAAARACYTGGTDNIEVVRLIEHVFIRNQALNGIFVQ